MASDWQPLFFFVWQSLLFSLLFLTAMLPLATLQGVLVANMINGATGCAWRQDFGRLAEQVRSPRPYRVRLSNLSVL